MELEIQERLLQECMSFPIIKHLYENPIDFGQFKVFQSFESEINYVISTSLSDGYTDLRYELLQKICLDIACKNGQTTFVKTLLNQGANTNTMNKTYNRAPIHFATEGGYVGTLKALLEMPIDLNLQGTEQSQTALHIAVNRNDEMCALLLLENGASANIPNSEGLTAIHQAAMNKQRNMVKLILKEHWHFLDLDNYWDHNHQSTRELINQNLPDLQLMIQNLAFPIRNYCDLQYYLFTNEPNFLNVQFDENFSSVAVQLLEIATENDRRQALTRILDLLQRREREEESFKNKVIPVAHMAVKKGRYVILRKLIKLVPEIINDLIMAATLQLEEVPRSRLSGWLTCMTLMLNQEGVNIRDLKDSKSNTPLYYAAKSGYIEVITLFLDKHWYIGHKDNNIPLLVSIPMNTLKNYFDKCSQMTNERTNKCTIEFNYRCLKPCNVSPTNSYDLMKNREMQLFEDLVHSKNKRLITHPLLSSFLYLKCYKIQYFLLTNLVLNMFFYFTLISYILIMVLNSSENKNGTNNENLNSINLNCITNISKSSSSQNIYHYILCPIISIWLIFLIFGEILQFVHNPRYYIKDWINGLQIMLFGLTVAFLCVAGVEIGIAVILLATWKLMIIISLYPRFSIINAMLRTVCYNLVYLFSPYIFLIVVFFYIFSGVSNLLSFFNPDFADDKTIIKFTKIVNVIWDNINIFDSAYSTWFSLVLVILIFLMFIILTNIRGMTLIDADTWSQAELNELIYQTQLIANFENFACMIGELMIRYFFNNSSQIFDSFVNKIFLFRNYLKDDKITFWIHDTENFDEEFNTPLHDAAELSHSEVISLFRTQDYYSHTNKFNVLPLAYVPNGILATYFNECVRRRQNESCQEIIVEPSSTISSLPDNIYRNNHMDNNRHTDLFLYTYFCLLLNIAISKIRYKKSSTKNDTNTTEPNVDSKVTEEVEELSKKER